MAKAHLILSPHRPNIETFRRLPFFYEAGPVLGAEDWHYNLTTLLEDSVGECVIANPSSYRVSHPHYGRRLEGPVDFDRQKLWERHYMSWAACDAPRGALIFWLPKESTKKPRNDGNPYAMDTRGEVGEWRGRLLCKPNLRVLVGAEDDFPGLDSIVCDFNTALGGRFRLYQSLEELAEAARLLTRPPQD